MNTAANSNEENEPVTNNNEENEPVTNNNEENDSTTDEESEEEDFAVANSINAPSANAGVSITQLQTLNLETALMAIQSGRASLLEDQLKNQLNDVNARNSRIAEMNEDLSIMRTVSSSLGDKSTTLINSEDKKKYESILTKYGIDSSKITNKGELDKAMENVKSLIDGESNSQQMDMLRLQSLSNKRNEAFDLMSNFVKKMRDSRSSIISNMR